MINGLKLKASSFRAGISRKRFINFLYIIIFDDESIDVVAPKPLRDAG
jgi:hypothetical protein